MNLNRTRIIFVLILFAAFAVICGSVGYNLIKEELNSNGSTSTTENNNPSPPKNALTIQVASSSTKRNWMDQIVAQFNSAEHTTSSGQQIFVQISHVTSGGSMNDILAGTIQPIAWSPGDQSWVDQANESWQVQTNKPIASQNCAPSIYAPLGFAMWRPMAETLGWPDAPIGWDTIVSLAADPNGWGSYGRPEWGQFRFGHTHPGYANSGLLSMTGFVHGVVKSEGQLTTAQVYEAEDAMRTLEQVTSKYGRSSPAILEQMTLYGPSYLHAAAVPEADVLKFNQERASELAFPLVFIFPSGGTIWADHPFCILDNAPWATDEQVEAGTIFQDFVLSEEQQSLAIDNYLRPLDTNIPLRFPISLENGTDPRINPSNNRPLPSPDAEISSSVIDLFMLTKRKATIIIALDVSGSMNGEKIQTATQATADFLERLDANDEVAIYLFSDFVVPLSDPVRVGGNIEGLTSRVRTLLADGSTALHQAVCDSTELAKALQVEDTASGETRLYGIILLSDGEDTIGTPTENQMFTQCLPPNPEADGIKIFPIAFGDGADETILARIAKTSGGQLFKADPKSISNIYLTISAEQ